MFLHFWGEEERWLGCVPTRTGRKDLHIGCFQIFFSDASGFSVKKDTTILHCLSMFVAIFLIFPLKATGLYLPKVPGLGQPEAHVHSAGCHGGTSKAGPDA